MKTITFSVNFLVVAFAVFCTVARATFTCTQEGVFKDPDSTDCTGFIYCNSNLQASSHQCDSQNGAYPTYFWPEKQICYSYYDCLTGSPPNNDNTNPCEGLTYASVRDKYTTDCSSYIQCSQQYFYSTIPVAYKFNCASGSYFRPDSSYCTSNYVCTNYECQAEGYVSDPASSDCSTFISCEKSGNQLLAFVINCPANTKFSPYLKKCDSYYVCGGSDPHQGVDPCSNHNWENVLAVNDLQNDCTTYFSCQQQLYDYKEYEVILKNTCPANTLFSKLLGKCYYNHVCGGSSSGECKDPCQSGNGRYVDYESSDCRSFLECKSDEGNEIYKPYMDRRYCAYGSFFNPAISDCDRNYVCPRSSYCYAAVRSTLPPTTTTTTTTAAAG